MNFAGGVVEGLRIEDGEGLSIGDVEEEDTIIEEEVETDLEIGETFRRHPSEVWATTMKEEALHGVRTRIPL